MKKVLFSLTVLVFVVACQKEVSDEIPADTSGDCLLVRMVQGTNDGLLDDTTFEFTYNDTGRLEQITWISEGLPDFYDLAYDDNGRLLKISQAMDPGNSLESRFSYDSEGRLHELFYHRFSDPSKIVYEYGSGNLPERAVYYDNVGGQWTEMSTYEYTFTNGNVTKSDLYDNGVYKWSHHFEYDSALPNNMGVLPLISFNSIPLGFYEEFLFFNKNLPKKLSWDWGTDYDVEYIQEDGKIVQSIGTYVHQGTSSQRDTRNYFFECK